MAGVSKVGMIFAAFNAVASVCAFALGDVADGLFLAGGAAGAFMLARKGDEDYSSHSTPPQPKSGYTL